MNNKEYIAKLNKLRASEMRMSLTYRMAAQMLTGPWRDGLAKEFVEHSKDELRHADAVMQRIIALGGVIDTAVEPIPAWKSLDAVLGGLEQYEKEGINQWYELYNAIPADEPFRHVITE